MTYLLFQPIPTKRQIDKTHSFQKKASIRVDHIARPVIGERNRCPYLIQICDVEAVEQRKAENLAILDFFGSFHRAIRSALTGCHCLIWSPLRAWRALVQHSFAMSDATSTIWRAGIARTASMRCFSRSSFFATRRVSVTLPAVQSSTLRETILSYTRETISP